jgi:hypothetical protein
MARRSSSALADRLSWIERTRGAATCRLNWPGRAAIGLLVIGSACLIATVDIVRARAAQADGAVEKDAPVRAYRHPLKAAAKFHTITLTVLDDETGKPLSGAEATVLNYVELLDYRFRTDSAGRLRFEYPYIGSPRMLNVEVRKNGYVPVRAGAYREDDPDRKPRDEITIRLRRGTTMGGIVVYAGDRPVEGVTVVMTVNKYGPGKRPENPTGHEIYYEVPTKTGPDGRWRTDSVPPGAEQVRLHLLHPDYVMEGTLIEVGRSPKIADLLNQTDRQVLTKGARITGRVIDADGEPVTGARVVDSTRGLTFLDFMREAFTDDGGWFHLHFGRGGMVRLTAQVKGYEPATLEFTPEPDTPPLEFRVKKSKGLRGRVVDQAGKPIAGAQVVLFSRGAYKDTNFLTHTDVEGRFEWDSAPETATYYVDAEGYAPPIEMLSLTTGDGEVAVALKPALDLSLHVVDAETGKLIERFAVAMGQASPDGEVAQWEKPSAHEYGYFSISRELTGVAYQFKISAAGYASVQTRSFRDEERVVREVIKLRKEKK